MLRLGSCTNWYCNDFTDYTRISRKNKAFADDHRSPITAWLGDRRPETGDRRPVTGDLWPEARDRDYLVITSNATRRF